MKAKIVRIEIRSLKAREEFAGYLAVEGYAVWCEEPRDGSFRKHISNPILCIEVDADQIEDRD